MTAAESVFLRIVGVLASIAAVTFIGYRAGPVNATTAGFAYIVAILFIAAKWGFLEASLGSIAALLCLNFFFLPPVGTFTIADPQNWIALLAFLVTSFTASRLSAQARRRTLEALSREADMERLYALSRSILLMDPAQSVPRQLANHVAQSFGASAVALYDRETRTFYRSGAEDFPLTDDQLNQAALHGDLIPSEKSMTRITAIRLGAEPIGSLGIAGVELSPSALQGLANLVAIGLERARAQETASRAEAARRSDELKSTLLDAIAHEFKTPLTTIKAATTALLSDQQPQSAQQREYIAIMDEEAERLSGLVTEAIQMSRIEGGRVHLRRTNCSVRDLVTGVLDEMKSSLEGRRVVLKVLPEPGTVYVDRDLIALTLRQLLDNAVKYSPPGSPIAVSSEAQETSIVISVADRGPGIPEAEQSRVFEKFYRARDSGSKMPGAGLGLAIAYEIVQAHLGRIWVESTPGEGSIFHVSLPTPRAETSQ